jgi:uncharacterized DUF497 family protein
MRISFDPAKSLRNEEERGIPFGMAAVFEWNEALVVQDLRED